MTETAQAEQITTPSDSLPAETAPQANARGAVALEALFQAADAHFTFADSWESALMFEATGTGERAERVEMAKPVAYWGGRLGDLALENGAARDPGGVAGEAYSFDGTDDVALSPHRAAYAGTEMTLSFWFKADAAGTAQSLVSKDAAFTGAGEFALELTDAGQVALAFETGAGERQVLISPTLDVTAWQHVALSIAAEDGVSLYLNGVAAGWLPAASGLGDNDAPFVFASGVRAHALGSDDMLGFYAGRLDEIGVFAEALEAEAIGDLYAMGVEGEPLAEDSFSFW